MLTSTQIRQLLDELNDLLKEQNVTGEICLYGGTVMCLVYEARVSTKDVDAIFHPTDVIRRAASQIAQNHALRDDWLNDAMKGFLTEHPKREYIALSHLRVFVPEPDYLLAMKAMSARVDTRDKDDVIFLIKHLGLTRAEEVFSLLEKYYPARLIRPVTRFFIEEIMSV